MIAGPETLRITSLREPLQLSASMYQYYGLGKYRKLNFIKFNQIDIKLQNRLWVTENFSYILLCRTKCWDLKIMLTSPSTVE